MSWFIKILWLILAFLMATFYVAGFHAAGAGSLVLDVFVVAYMLFGAWRLTKMEGFGGGI